MRKIGRPTVNMYIHDDDDYGVNDDDDDDKDKRIWEMLTMRKRRRVNMC